MARYPPLAGILSPSAEVPESTIGSGTSSLTCARLNVGSPPGEDLLALAGDAALARLFVGLVVSLSDLFPEIVESLGRRRTPRTRF
jgi:hypothetical protein